MADNKNPLPPLPGDGKEFIDLTAAVEQFRILESVLQESAPLKKPSGNAVSLPLGQVIEWASKTHSPLRPLTEEEKHRKIVVHIDNLFAQLAKGKVMASLASLVFEAPADIVPREMLNDKTSLVSIPLPALIEAIGADSMEKQITQTVREYDISELPDPFQFDYAPHGTDEKPPEPEKVSTEPSEPEPIVPEITDEKPPEPDVPQEIEVSQEIAEPEPGIPVEPQVSAEPASEIQAEPETSAEPEPPPEPAVIPTPALPPEPDSPPEPVVAVVEEEPPEPVVAVVEEKSPEPATPPSAETTRKPSADRPVQFRPGAGGKTETIPFAPCDRLGGLNANTASLEQWMAIPGMRRTLAERIIAYRHQNGSFTDIFDLHNVPGLGNSLFRAITGMNYNDKRYHRRTRLSQWLRIPVDRLDQIPQIVEALSVMAGFRGCILSDRDGLLLAQSAANQVAEALSAVAPRLLGQVRENVREFTSERVDHVSVCVSDRMFTMVASGRIFLTAIHETNKLTKKQFVLIQRVAAELEWLLSYRAYVEPGEPPRVPASPGPA